MSVSNVFSNVFSLVMCSVMYDPCCGPFKVSIIAKLTKRVAKQNESEKGGGKYQHMQFTI